MTTLSIIIGFIIVGLFCIGKGLFTIKNDLEIAICTMGLGLTLIIGILVISTV